MLFSRVRVDNDVSCRTHGTSVGVIYDSLMGKMNVAGDAICIQVPRVTPHPEDVTVKAQEVTRRVKEHGIQWCSKEDLRDRKNSINYILQTRLSIAEENHSTRSWTGPRNWTGSRYWAGSRAWTGPMVWTGSKDCTGSKECNGFREWTGSNNWTGSVDHSESKDWTSSTETKGNSFIDLLQTVPTSEDDEEVQGLLCLSHHPKVTDLTSDLERFEGQQTTEAEPACETTLRDLANVDNSSRQMAAQRPELDFRKMQVTQVSLKSYNCNCSCNRTFIQRHSNQQPIVLGDSSLNSLSHFLLPRPRALVISRLL